MTSKAVAEAEWAMQANVTELVLNFHYISDV
jgi:hypothetical protein